MSGVYRRPNIVDYYEDFVDYRNTLSDHFAITSGTGGSAALTSADDEGAGGVLKLSSTAVETADVMVGFTHRIWRPDAMGIIQAKAFIKISADPVGLFFGFTDDPTEASGALPIDTEGGTLTTTATHACGLLYDESAADTQQDSYRLVSVINDVDGESHEIKHARNANISEIGWHVLKLNVYEDGSVDAFVGRAHDFEGGKFGTARPLAARLSKNKTYSLVLAQAGRGVVVDTLVSLVSCRSQSFARGV